MDAKKRVAVPASWLNGEVGQTFHVIPHPSGEYLVVMPPKEFELLELEIKGSVADPKLKRRAIREFFGGSHEVTTDKQGRVLLNDKHCERTGLGSEVVFIGGRSRFEIWSREAHIIAKPGQMEALQQVADLIGL